MMNTIAVMNTKGGVGKSTLVLALAETLSAFHGKNVLVIDSDAQASVSSMLMSVPDLYKLQSDGRTIVDYLVATVLNAAPTDWTQFIVPKVSDVDDARGVYLLPSDMQLTLLEREVSKESQHSRLRASIGRLLADSGNVFDIVLVDCPPGLSVLTECWLREADFHVSPTKPDYVSICGLEVFRRFKALNPEMGFARNLGVIVNLADATSATDSEYTAWLAANADNRCFAQSVPRVKALQDAARHQSLDRSYAAKYPGVVGQAMRALAAELVERLQVDQTAAALAAAAEEVRRAEATPRAQAPAQAPAEVPAQLPAQQPPGPAQATAQAAPPAAPAAAAETPAVISKAADAAAGAVAAATAPAAVAPSEPAPPAQQPASQSVASQPATAQSGAAPSQPVMQTVPTAAAETTAAPAKVAPPPLPSAAPGTAPGTGPVASAAQPVAPPPLPPRVAPPPAASAHLPENSPQPPSGSSSSGSPTAA